MQIPWAPIFQIPIQYNLGGAMGTHYEIYCKSNTEKWRENYYL